MTKLLELLTAMGVSFDTFTQMQSLANRMVGLGYPEVTLAEGLAKAEEEQSAAATAGARSFEGATGTG
jgi:ribosomal protein L12E/L44/L45/RPP1/RPP2